MNTFSSFFPTDDNAILARVLRALFDYRYVLKLLYWMIFGGVYVYPYQII